VLPLMDRGTPGEQWTVQQLTELRRQHFSPRAQASFLRASLQQSRRTRQRRRALAIQAHRWIAIGAAGWLALWALRGRDRPRRQFLSGLAWWASCGAMLDWHLGMVETADGVPRPLGPADALTLFRAWLVPLAWQKPTPVVCGLAFLSDAADGPLARSGAPTRAGHDFDWILDACFATAALRGSKRENLLATWAVGAEAAWLTTGLVRATLSYFARSEPPDRTLTRRARPFAAIRAAGVVCAAAGHRTTGSLLLGAGAVASIATSAPRAVGQRKARHVDAEPDSRRAPTAATLVPLAQVVIP
jgi:phosphatidylglycerophosphate synthase